MKENTPLQTVYSVKNGWGLKIFFLLLLLFFIIAGKAQNVDSTIRAFQRQLAGSKEDTAYVLLLLKFGNFYTNQNGAYQQLALTTDQQALALSDKLKSPELQNKCLLQLAIQYGILRNFKKSRICYLAVLNYWDSRHNLTQTIASLDYLQIMFRWGPNRNVDMLNETVSCLKLEQAAFLRAGDTLKAVLHLKDEGDAYLNMGKLDLAEHDLLEVLKQLKNLHYHKLRDTYFLLSSVNHIKGNLNQELYYCIEAMKEAQANKDKGSIDLLYYKTARLYEDMGMYENSRLFFEKLLPPDPSDTMVEPLYIYYRICLVLVKENKPTEALHLMQNAGLKYPPHSNTEKSEFFKGLATCYIALKQNDLAEHYLLKMSRTAFYNSNVTSINNESCLLDNMQISEFYVARENYTKASYYLKKVLAIPQFNISALNRGYVQFLQFKVDSANGNLISAIRHFEIYKKINDSVFSIRKSDQVNAIKIKYETDRKDRDILLLKKQAIIDQEKIKRRRLIGNLLIVGSLLLLILLTGVYSQYLLKQRNVKLLEEKQLEISGKNHALEKLLHENEWLLKEVHHRIKNNLQTVTSLLHSQSSYLKDETALNAVMDSQHRIQAMSLIHQKLYKSSNATNIYMPEYIGELVDYLKDSFKIGLHILFDLDIAPVMLDVVFAVPVGLILNELITNAVKYAFPFSENDSVLIKFLRIDEYDIGIEFRDNGRGMPEGYDINKNDSFGMILIKGLIDDLSGSFLLETGAGTTVTICFSTNQRNEYVTNETE